VQFGGEIKGILQALGVGISFGENIFVPHQHQPRWNLGEGKEHGLCGLETWFEIILAMLRFIYVVLTKIHIYSVSFLFLTHFDV
jgi:hypothetical protein